MSDNRDAASLAGESDGRSDRSDSRGGRYEGGRGGGGARGGRTFYRKKVCKVCVNKMTLDYKEPDSLRRFVTERGKILPRRITGTCAKHQRWLAKEVKKARVLALLPFVVK